MADDANDDGSLSLVNVPFVLAGLDGGLVNGGYTLTIDDEAVNDVGTLTSWSVTIDAETPGSVLQTGDQDDQNADGTSDENPPDDGRRLQGPDPGRRLRHTHARSDDAGDLHHGPGILSPSISRSTTTPCR